ncbi:TPA: hypothetical protein RM800_002116 [Yersinia enterocolitica]|uniref:hypothetical protein n=1 Tax=Yersinia similis TaxID=367190 RepID=UPI0011A2AA59|nr:hypothetical protein [Yersinia similis]EKN5910882.1 hypothetical protein [Yersinia enterocolitica]HDW8042089.1 hypothetical protein [Yersinia enterocolitica]HEM6610159.1 hypothetical protein [Yersinia enterocolitica]
MSQKITFSTNYVSTIEAYKEYSKNAGCSLSATISQVLHTAAPTFLKKQIPFISGESKKTDTEFFLDT